MLSLVTPAALTGEGGWVVVRVVNVHRRGIAFLLGDT
jgi:hypothetical protein